jgi:hypothetical protein
MVTRSVLMSLPSVAQTTAEPAQTLLQRLDPYRSTAIVMALLGIVILGIFLVTMVMLGGHWVRRHARHRKGPTTNTINIANQRLRDALEPMLPTDGKTDETTVVRRGSDDTVVDS